MPVSYDVVISSPFSNYEFFAHRMMELCGQMGLTFFYVNDVWVKEFHQKLIAKEVAVRVMLDLTATQTDTEHPYTQLAHEVKRQSGYVIDDPDVTALAAHKGNFHQMLIDELVPVPETIIIPREQVDSFEIDEEVERRVGVPFVVKPAWGDSGVGVIVDATSKEELLRSVEEAPNSDAFLIQHQVSPRQLGNHLGWFRQYYIMGEVISCWWDPRSHEYHLVTPGQMREYRLTPIHRIVQGIARASGMKKFSCEVCLNEDGRFYTVDYVNADPDMNPQSYYDNGVPDAVVEHIVWLLFTEAMRVVKRDQGFFDEYLAEAELGWLEQRRSAQSQ